MENLPIGYLSCRSCGSIENCVEIAQLIRDYQQSEGVRLKNVPEAYRVS